MKNYLNEAISIIFKSVLHKMSFIKILWTKSNEIYLNINTISRSISCDRDENRSWWRGPKSDKVEYDDNYVYASPDYWYIRKIANKLNLRSDDIIYDVGSGMGRIVCIMAQRALKKCVGIELFEFYCNIARQNAASLRKKRTPIHIYCADAAKVNMSDGTIYFFFNPFGPDTMRCVFNNIEKSLLSNPRKIKIVYYNAVHENILSSFVWLKNYYSIYTLSGLRISFWCN